MTPAGLSFGVRPRLKIVIVVGINAVEIQRIRKVSANKGLVGSSDKIPASWRIGIINLKRDAVISKLFHDVIYFHRYNPQRIPEYTP